MKVLCWICYGCPIELADIVIGMNYLTKLILMHEDYIVHLSKVFVISIISNNIDFLGGEE